VRLRFTFDSCDGIATELAGLASPAKWEGVGWKVDQGLLESDRWRNGRFWGGNWFGHATDDWQLLDVCCVTRLGATADRGRSGHLENHWPVQASVALEDGR
jgi:hypothetical protein